MTTTLTIGTPATDNSKKLYTMAASLLGQVLGSDNAADGYGAFACAESVNAVAMKAFGKPIGGGASTSAMLAALYDTTRFVEVLGPLPGDIIICATGTSIYGANFHGHVGIVAKYGILSNNSEDGKFEEDYTLETWKESFTARGFPTHFFRML